MVALKVFSSKSALDIEETLIIIESEGTVVVNPQGNDTSLTILTLTVSTVGITLSTVSLILLLLTASLFAEWRQNYKNQLLIQFIFARVVYTLVVYFNDITVAFELYDRNEILAQLDLLFVFYSELALVFWMFVFSRQMYIALVKVFISQHHLPLWKVSLFTWTTPVVITVIPVAAIWLGNVNELKLYFLYLTLVKWPTLIANGVYLILTTKSILRHNRSSIECNTRIVIVMIVLIYVFCFQQFFADVYKIVYLLVYLNYESVPSYLRAGVVLFNLYSLYHCAFSILFWVFGNTQTRKLWKVWLERNKRQSPVGPDNSDK